MKLRTGIGFDVHQLAGNRKLILGGVEIPYHKGAVAHSDGDVLIHAICDALLGACGLEDIGSHFPDSDDKFKGIDSKILLRKTGSLVSGEGYSISNIDSVVCLQQPKINQYVPSMRQTIASVLGIDPEDVSVKATTTEKLGFVGREEGISAYATALLIK